MTFFKITKWSNLDTFTCKLYQCKQRASQYFLQFYALDMLRLFSRSHFADKCKIIAYLLSLARTSMKSLCAVNMELDWLTNGA